MAINRTRYLSNLYWESKPSTMLSTCYILNFLNDKELLTQRLTCQTFYKATQKILGPYENFIQFILGTTQFYTTEKELKAA